MVIICKNWTLWSFLRKTLFIILILQTFPYNFCDEIVQENYASKECNAKVLFANEEAENKDAILNDKERDDYMRNPCQKAQHKFLIIELCENIQPTMLQIANFELFSSGPKDIRLSASERYPTLEWIVIGEFVALDTRDFQSFPINPYGSFVKFIKLELLTHHGREHYCTLTSLRLYGISMVDEYEAEAAVIESNLNQNNLKINNPVVSTTIKEELTEEKEQLLQELYINKEEDYIPIRKNRFSYPIDHFCSTCNLYNQKLPQNNWICHIINGNNTLEFMEEKNLFSLNFSDINLEKQYNASLTTKPDFKPADVCTFKDKFLNKTESTENKTLFLNNSVEIKNAEIKPETESTISFTQLTPTIIPIPQTSASNGNEHLNHQPQPILMPYQQPTITSKPSHILSNQQNSLPGSHSNAKESVFMKLNKRLSALELNISLSGEHFNEVNRKYQTQIDELIKQHDKTLKENALRNARDIQNIQNEILLMKKETALQRLREDENFRKITKKLKVENRLLKQKIKDLQEIVDSLRSKKIINDEQLIMGHIVENVDGETATTFTGTKTNDLAGISNQLF